MSGCCSKARTSSPSRKCNQNSPHKEEIILRIAGATAHLLEPEGLVELAKGDLVVLSFAEEEAVLAIVVKVGDDLQWPLTRDEPVVKVDGLHYLFSLLAREDGGFLNYGVSFTGPDSKLDSLDTFLKENACFSSIPSGPSVPKPTRPTASGGGYWRQYLPSIGDYDKVLEKAVAGGTGLVIKGIYAYTNAYSNQVRKGAELLQPKNVTNKTSTKVGDNKINKSIRRVRKVSEMTEKMSRSLLNGVTTITGAVGAPIAKSKAGKAVLGSIPGGVLLSTLDAVKKVLDAVETVERKTVDATDKVLDAVETAERKTIEATGGAVAGVVSKRFGENVGQATEDLFATTGHTVGMAWNCFKIRKAVTPSSSSLSSSILKNAIRKKT